MHGRVIYTSILFSPDIALTSQVAAVVTACCLAAGQYLKGLVKALLVIVLSPAASVTVS